ncbi:putative lipoprotein [Ruegeria intermedia]|uniref:Putative lipoprotein n=1 Tax=Ruegeria intermedia TaxID=996115 RepID=A0A1M4TZS2_9RHOB|nr:YbaY family lipoprotein [Ruegeria intermedia]SHE49920.1 putative lipoprotein [Ruegeria intermedia]
MQTAKSLLAGTALWAAVCGAAQAGTVEGTATYRERIAVPPGATLFVELQDVSRADAPAVTLAAQRYALTGVPAQFALTYDDALIQDRHRYVVRASVHQDGKLLFTTDTAYPVLTNDAGNSVDLVMVKVQERGAAMLENTQWTATEVNGVALDAEKRPQITFAEGGAFGGTGGCNRFSGQAEISGKSMSFPDNMAATLMACPPPLDEVEREFLAALPKVASFVQRGDTLVLVDAAGEPVLQFRRDQ